MVLAASDIAGEALRQVGMYSPYDTGPSPDTFPIALRRLEMILAELIGTEKLWFFVPASVEINLEANKSSYILNAYLNDPFQFIQNVEFQDENEKIRGLDLIRRAEFEDRRDETFNRPELVYVERNDSPTLYIYGAPIVSGTKLILQGQKYHNEVDVQDGQAAHGLPAAWELALVYELAADIGSGPVTTLPAQERRELRGIAKGKFDKLIERNNRENVRRPRYTRPRRF